MSDQFLYGFQKQPAPDFRNRLYTRISSEPPYKSSVFPALAYGLVGVMLGLAMLLAVSPPARIYAQEIIYSIGQWIISHKPTSAEQFESKLESGEIGVYDTSGDEVIEWQAPEWIPIEEAQAMAGFTLFQLQLDERDARPVFRELQFGNDGITAISVTTVYQLQEGNLVFRQTKNEDGIDSMELPVGGAEVSLVTFAAGEGYWIEGLRLSTFVNEENKVEPKYANVLLWADDEFEFWLQSSPGLSFENMLQMAQQIY